MRLTFIHDGNDAFIQDLIAAFRSEYEVKVVRPKTDIELRNALENTDIAWLEWCNQITAIASHAPKTCKLVCRFIAYEMLTAIPKSVRWANIDNVVFLNRIVQEYSSKAFDIPKAKQVFIPCGVDINRFVIPDEKIYGKRVVYVGYINVRKGPMLMLQLFKTIHDYDNSFRFHIRGEFQDWRIREYMDRFLRVAPFSIQFDPWQSNMTDYFADKDYVISTSLFEGFHYTVAEGMACGLVPLIHSWPGADEIYPQSNIFTYPGEAIEMISRFENAENKRAERKRARQHIVDHFPLEQQIDQTRAMLKELVA